MCRIVGLFLKNKALEPKLGQILIAKSKLGQCAEQNWRKLRGFDYPLKSPQVLRSKTELKPPSPARSPQDQKPSNTRLKIILVQSTRVIVGVKISRLCNQ